MTHDVDDGPHQPSRRAFVAGALAGVGVGLAGCGPARPTRGFDAVVSPARADRGGARRFSTIAAAIDAAPRDGHMPWRVLVRAGEWKEKLVVDRPHVHLVGEGVRATLVHHDTAAGMARPDGEPWGTWGCASLIVRAPGFRASSLTIANSFDYVGNLASPRFEAIGANGPQAVALMLADGSDDARFDDVAITGHQDTLFVDAGRSTFRDCTITGSVDFIFGGGQAVLQRCTVQSRFRPDKPRQGYVVAPSTSRASPYGIVLVDCALTREPAIPDGSVALGRAWRPTRTFDDGRYGDPDAVGAAAFIRCTMDAHIAPEGWDAMAYTARDGSRVMLSPADARLVEFSSRGPGALLHVSRKQLTAAEADRLLGLLARR